MKVLVIGGGFGGLAACTGLRNAERGSCGGKKASEPAEIILVEPKDHIEIFWTAFRSPFDEDVAANSLYPLAPVCHEKDVKHIQSTVTELTKTRATLANGESIDFDVAVIATGAAYAKWPALGRGLVGASVTREERLAALKAEGEKYLRPGGSVLIVGGGLVGSELAGDLLAHARKKGASPLPKVTLVQSGSQLCPEMSAKAASMVHTKLKKLGVEVILNEKVVEENGRTILQNSGKEIQADQVVYSVGVQPVNSFVDPSFLNDKGWVDVDEHYQVRGAEGSLFAMGDCCTLLHNAANQVMANIDVMGHNLKAVLDAKRSGSTKSPVLGLKKPSSMAVYVCTVGTEDGVADLGFTHTQYLLPSYKNRTLFLDVPQGKFGLKKDS